MTQVIAISNLKGGVGKTTTSMFLATILSKNHKVLIKDADPQGSLTEWIDLIKEDNELPFDFTIANQKSVGKIEDKYEYIIIDTPPGNGDIINASINVSDLVIIPTTTGGIDLSKVMDLVGKIEGKKQYGILLNQTSKNPTLLQKMCIEQLNENDLSYFETTINKKEAIKRTFGYIPDDELDDYKKLVEEIFDNKLLIEER